MVGTVEYDFTGDSAIVTGSTKGIGRGIARALVEAGADVIVNSRTPDDVEQTADELTEMGPGRAVGVPADMADPSGIESLVETAIDTFDTIDLLVNNAAVWPREPSMLDAELEDWDHTMDVNVRSQFYAAKLLGRHMIEEDVDGNVINITSHTGDRRSGDPGLYGVSKTAINGLTWRLAHDLAQHGIRVNAVSTVSTDSYQLRLGARKDLENPTSEAIEARLQESAESMPIGRLGEPADIADAVLFLASDRASYIVGDVLRVSGGGNLQ